jgi:hypothetical protein
MTRFFLAAGVAALAITAPVGAKPGGGGGGGGHGGGNGGQAAQAQHGGGGYKASKAERHGGGGQRFANFDRSGKGGGNSHAFKAERHAFKADRQFNKHVNRVAKIDRQNIVRVRDLRGDKGFDTRFASRGLIEGCPPGLWKKNNGCMPPGQLKNSLLGRAIPLAYSNGMVPLGLKGLYADTPDYYYRYGDGYMYRVDRQNNLVESLLPLMGGGYMPGQMFPSAYSNYYVPQQYQAFYPDSSDYYYRYNNGYVYQVDRGTSLIAALIPLLTGGTGYGQMLPASYSMYNVPYQYRGMYYDTPDYSYRYAPGAIYQVDPRTSLITGVPTLLAGDLALGAPLPLGYSAYNVPLAYRASYYDTPTALYRYNDGYIYRVDPTTQLVTAVINALV